MTSQDPPCFRWTGRLLSWSAACLAAAAIWCAPGPARAEGLALFILPAAGETPGENPPSFSPGDEAGVRLLLENRGRAPTGTVTVTLALRGARLAVPGPWREAGDHFVATMDDVPPAGAETLELAVVLATPADAEDPGTGAEATIRITAENSGETLLATQRWSTSGCADAYHLALQRVRVHEFARLRAGIDETKDADSALPGRLLFDAPRGENREDTEVAQLAARIARARGADPFYQAEQIRWLALRVSEDLDIYLGQPRYPGLCTGVGQWADTLAESLEQLRERLKEVETLAARARLLTGEAAERLPPEQGDGLGQASADTGQDPAGAAYALLAASGIDLDGTAGFSIFREAPPALEASGLSGDSRARIMATLGALEQEWYVLRALEHAEAVAGGFEATFSAIRSAHAATCTCSR